MRTYHFYQKNSSVNVFLTADSFEEAEEILFDHVKDSYGWRCDDEDGEEEDED
jgi:hypothetical protein